MLNYRQLVEGVTSSKRGQGDVIEMYFWSYSTAARYQGETWRILATDVSGLPIRGWLATAGLITCLYPAQSEKSHVAILPGTIENV